jgi:F-type H+-transporting ATPase subunit b
MCGLENSATLIVASSEGGGGGNFLVTPGAGVMIWTLIAFGVTVLLLRKLAYPRISEALDKRRLAIEESIDHAQRMRDESDALLREYRERLREAREQADDIVVRARKAAENVQEQAKLDAKQAREELMEQTRHDIEQETRRSLDRIRKEVADLTVLATEKVARKTLDDDDHRRLIEDALEEFDFSNLPGGGRRAGTTANGGGGDAG